MTKLRIRLWRSAPIALLVLNGSCADQPLRGKTSRSPDGLTYLIVADDNGGKCGTVQVDGRPWPQPIGAHGRVSPGLHTISCGTEVTIQVDSGKTFRFDYWGP